jgi:glutathione synthase/RimK-type ligase-like ATP-grasp enzyme
MGWIVMIFLWGLLQDDTFRSVYDCLLRRSVEIAFVNHALIGRTRVEFSGQPEPDYRLSCGKRVYELNSMSAAYLRPYDHRLYEDEKTSSRKISPPDVVHHLLMSWAEHTAVMTINRPSAEATNQSKLYQAMLICRAGLRVPASLVSNDVEEIERFTAEKGRVIYKSMSSVRSIVQELDIRSLRSLGAMGPAMFQQRIEGRNVRVHVVGEETVACTIESGATDYRYGESRMAPVSLPSEVAARCVGVTRELGLVLSGIDLIETEEGEYYCLEVNPSPAFSVFQRASSRSIADLVADRLMAS